MTATLHDQAAAAQAEANRLRAEADRIDAAGRALADEVRLAHYQRHATEIAGERRERRDGLNDRLAEIASADQLDLNELFKAYVEMRDEDARCGALNVHCSMLDTLDPPQRQWNGVHPMPARRAQCDELYKGMTFVSFLESVLSQRADRIRSQHRHALDAEAHAEVQAAEQAARTAAAGGKELTT